MKKFRIVVSVALCLLLAFGGAVACNDSNPQTGAPVAPAGSGDVELWGAPSTVKILRGDTDYEDKKEAALVYKAVRGEYESYQLIMTAKGNVAAYYLETADLTSAAGDTIGAECFEVYNEYYTQVNSVSHGNAVRGGYYPDALVPIDLAEAAGELTIAAGNNGALWVTVHVPEDAKAGQYTGEFTLTVDGKTFSVPVSLRVYDYLLTEESHFKTLFTTFDLGLANGEKDTTVEMKEKYYEFFLDYRINLDRYPVDSLNVNELVAQAKKYANDKRVTNYVLPYATDGGNFLNAALFQEQILALAKASTPEENLLAKASFYIVDEPEGNGLVESATGQLRELHAMLSETASAIEADTSGDYDGFKKIENWKSLIVDMTNVVTCAYGTGEMYQLINTWCPCWTEFTSAAKIEQNAAIKEQMGVTTWWYGCMSPKDPAPQYHLDGDLISSRAVNWLAQYYDIEGLLYWRVMAEDNTDVYDVPLFSKNATYPPGDGYLCYPGFKYGHSGPLPSMRLMSIRDGLEEYELLYALENEYADAEETFGTEFDEKNMVHDLYSRIHNNIYTTKDVDLFDTVRDELLAQSELSSFGAKFIVESTRIEDNKAKIVMYLDAANYSMEIDGKAVSPVSGNRFEYTLDLEKASGIDVRLVDKADAGRSYEFYKFVSNRTGVLISFGEDFDTSSVSGEDNLVVSVAGGFLNVSLSGKITGNEFADLIFEPYVSLALSENGGVSLSGYGNISFYVNNLKGEDLSFTVYLDCGNMSYNLGTAFLEGNAAKQFTFDLSSLAEADKGRASAIRFTFQNGGTVQAPAAWAFAVGELSAQYQ